VNGLSADTRIDTEDIGLEGEILGECSDKFNLRAHRARLWPDHPMRAEAFDSTTTFVPVAVRAYRSIAS